LSEEQGRAIVALFDFNIDENTIRNDSEIPKWTTIEDGLSDEQCKKRLLILFYYFIL
jgi:hypothetical protein